MKMHTKDTTINYIEYLWGVASATVILVLVYLIVPIDGKIESNRNKVEDLDVRVAVVEKTVEAGFFRIDKKLDKLDIKLDKLM